MCHLDRVDVLHTLCDRHLRSSCSHASSNVGIYMEAGLAVWHYLSNFAAILVRKDIINWHISTHQHCWFA